MSDALLDRLQNPDEKRDAFRELVDEYQRRIYWHIRKIVIDHDDANDLVQEVFIKIWNNIEQFRGESGLFTWIYRIATNESLTFMSKQHKRKGFFAQSDEEYLTNKLEADSFFDGEEIHKKLMQAVVKLPERQRLVFNMKYFDEMKYEQMAEILEVTVGSLKASYHHAVKKIEESFKITDF
jgi:RNA polymerase sigma-70 factor, ECF subfamily